MLVGTGAAAVIISMLFAKKSCVVSGDICNDKTYLTLSIGNDEI
jgi:hypothetical protein